MAITNPDYANLEYDEMAKAIGLKPKHIPLLIASFLEETTPLLEKIQASIVVNDFTAIRGNAHSIKGSSGNLRFNEVYEMAREMELAAEKNDASFAYAEYLSAITNAVATIKI